MRKLILIVHTSLDGFVAGVNGEFDGFEPGEDNLQFVCDISDAADAALFGRISYQLLNKYWPAAKDNPDASPGEKRYSLWYNHANKIVISKTLQGTDAGNTTIISDDILRHVLEIKQQAGKDILLFGSPSIAQLLMKSGLIDEYWVFVNPAIFGKGIPLFTELKNQIKLKLTETRQFSNGEFALHYSKIAG